MKNNERSYCPGGRKGHQFICLETFAKQYVLNHNENNSYNKFSLEYLKSLPNYKIGITQLMNGENERRRLGRLESGKLLNKESHREIQCPVCGTSGSATNIKRSHFEKCKYPIIKKYIESCLPDEYEFSPGELINNLKEKTGLGHSVLKTYLLRHFIILGGKSPNKNSGSNISYQKWIYQK